MIAKRPSNIPVRTSPIVNVSGKSTLNISGQPKVDLNTNVLDIEIPPQLEVNVSTGNNYFDALFARDGVTPSTVALVTGPPGVAKTTMMLSLADSITSTGNLALYNGLEESFYQIRKTAKRLDLKHGFIPSYEPTTAKLIQKANVLMEHNPDKQVFLFIDSLQCIEPGIPFEENKRGRGRPPKETASAGEVATVRMLTEWAKSTYGIVFIIGMVNKSGEFAGKQKLRHIVDVHLHLTTCTKKMDPDLEGLLVASMEKNRFGLAGVYYPYTITSTGITWDPVSHPAP